MAETWTRLLSSITDSSVWFEDDKTLRVWIAMMAMSDRDGYVWASVLGVANRAQVTVEQARAALDKFMGPDPESRSKDFDGRRVEEVDRGWLLLNKVRFRDMRDEDDRRRKERERKRAQREKKRHPENYAAPPEPAPPEPTDHDGSPDETVCPLDITKRAEAIYPDMLEHMPGVTVEQLRDKTREFLTYWTIGAGKFKKRRFWMRKLREDLRLAFEKRRLKAPGEIGHDDRKPRPVPMSDGAARLIQMAKEEDAKRRPRKVAAE